MKTLTIIFILIFSFAVVGQNIIATTDGGEKVILKPDKTWEYAVKPKTVAQTNDRQGFDNAFEFAKNNFDKIKKSEFETEAEYKKRLAEFYKPLQKENEFSFIARPSLFTYDAEERSFYVLIFKADSKTRLVDRTFGLYTSAAIRFNFPIDPAEAAKIKDQVEFIVYGFPVDFYPGGFLNELQVLPSRVEIKDKTTGKIYFEHKQSNFLAATDIDSIITSSPSLPSSKSTPGTDVRVKGYYRKDGTYVRPHTRSKPRRKN